MRRPASLVLVTALLVGLPGCLQEASAVDPWVTDGTVVLPDAAADATPDVPADTAPATGWSQVDLQLDNGESVVDWIGFTINDERILFYLTDWGRFGRIRPGQAAEQLHLYASLTAQAFRGLWTADGKSFWVVGKGNTVWKGKPALPSELSLKDELAGEWTGVWGDGASVIWLSGEGGNLLRLDADGKNAARYTITTYDWRSPTGAGDFAWLLSDTVLQRLTNGDFAEKPGLGSIKINTIQADQVPTRIVAVDASHLYLLGRPVQLIRASDATGLAFENAAIFSGINVLYDLSGVPDGHRLVCGVAGDLRELDASDVEVTVDKTGLPAAEDLKRVWLFDDGSAYVLSAVSGIFYRAPL